MILVPGHYVSGEVVRVSHKVSDWTRRKKSKIKTFEDAQERGLANKSLT